MTVVGHVAALWRYPVKSMAAEELDDAEVSWHGLAGDRRWAFIRDGQVSSGSPWLTMRERPELAHYRPRFVVPRRPGASPVLVRTPSGGELDAADPALAAELGPGGTRHQAGPRRLRHDAPVAADHAGPDRPRPAGWHRVGGRAVPAQHSRGRLRGGCPGGGRYRARLPRGRLGRPDTAHRRAADAGGPARPAMRDGDHRPGDVARDPAILRAIARERDARFGVYGSTVEPGRVAVGDPVELEC
jgi:uncharacterized protein